MDRESATAGNKRARRPVRGVVLVPCRSHSSVRSRWLWLTAGLDRWRLGEFLLLGAFVILSTLTDVNAGVSKVRVAGDPDRHHDDHRAAWSGARSGPRGVTIFVSWLRTRVAAHFALINLAKLRVVSAACRPFLLRGCSPLAISGLTMLAYYLVVFPTFVVALVGELHRRLRVSVLPRPRISGACRPRRPGAAAVRTVVLRAAGHGGDLRRDRDRDSWDRSSPFSHS